jgi:exosome complex exonuclease DIS3/RRP44
VHRAGADPAVLRERYLRDDVGCGIAGCTLCAAAPAPVLPAAGGGDPAHALFPGGHYVIPDANVFLAQVGPRPARARRRG